MRSFEYANPQTEAEALELLNDHGSDTAVLAGGTDFMNLMRRDLVAPQRVVDIKNVPSLKGVRPAGDGVLIGALTTLEDLLDEPLLADYRSLLNVVEATRAIQVQSAGTVGGDLCHLPNCWYYRNGYGLLAMQDGESLTAAGDNRYHAILGNQGAAKFVNASRFAPGLIAWGAKVRIIGPARSTDSRGTDNPVRHEADNRGTDNPVRRETATLESRTGLSGPRGVEEEFLPLEYFYVTPKTAKQGVTVLKPGQLLSHIWLPAAGSLQNATYEVLQTEGLDWPLAAAAATLELAGGLVRNARIVLGHVAPVPWVSAEAASSLQGQPITEETAARAGEIALANATPLSNNGYKVQLARTAVKRALLRATGQWEGGL